MEPYLRFRLFGRRFHELAYRLKYRLDLAIMLFTKARMIAIFTCMALSLLSTVESIATPCSVKA
jgi:hypothetical protein